MAQWRDMAEARPAELRIDRGLQWSQSLVDYQPASSSMEAGVNTAFHRCHITLGEDSTLRIGKGCILMGRIIVGDGACLSIGDGLVCNDLLHVHVTERGSVQIGNDCLFANPRILNSDMHAIFCAETGARCNPARDVFIGDRVWLATNALVLKGAELGSDTVVGAGEVVSGRFPPNVVLAGNPAKAVRSGVRWSRYLVEQAPIAFSSAFSDAALRYVATQQDHAAVIAMAGPYLQDWPRLDMGNAHVFYYLGRALFECHFADGSNVPVRLGPTMVTRVLLADLFRCAHEAVPGNKVCLAYAYGLSLLVGRSEEAARQLGRLDDEWAGKRKFKERFERMMRARNVPAEEAEHVVN